VLSFQQLVEIQFVKVKKLVLVACLTFFLYKGT